MELINTKQYYFWSGFHVQRGPMSGIVEVKNKPGALIDFMKNGIHVFMLEEISLEDYTMMKQQIESINKAPSLITLPAGAKLKQ